MYREGLGCRERIAALASSSQHVLARRRHCPKNGVLLAGHALADPDEETTTHSSLHSMHEIPRMINVGDKAPAFKLDDHLGKTVSSEDLYGKKNVMLLFYPLDFTPT